MPWRTRSGHRFLSHGWWNQNNTGQHGRYDAGQTFRRQLERAYGTDMSRWPSEVNTRLGRISRHSDQQRSLSTMLDWYKRQGWDIAMWLSSDTEGVFIRLTRRAGVNTTPSHAAQEAAREEGRGGWGKPWGSDHVFITPWIVCVESDEHPDGKATLRPGAPPEVQEWFRIYGEA